VRTLKTFQGTHILGASRGLLCDSYAVLLLIIIGWGESGRTILQVSVAVFSGAVETFFGQRWLSSLEKMTRTPMHLWADFHDGNAADPTPYQVEARCFCTSVCSPHGTAPLYLADELQYTADF